LRYWGLGFQHVFFGEGHNSALKKVIAKQYNNFHSIDFTEFAAKKMMWEDKGRKHIGENYWFSVSSSRFIGLAS
jgi:hypothetical protein